MADQTKARQDEDVNLGVAKKPEQVHIEHRVATTPWVESGGVSVAIGEEHRESTRKHWHLSWRMATMSTPMERVNTMRTKPVRSIVAMPFATPMAIPIHTTQVTSRERA